MAPMNKLNNDIAIMLSGKVLYLLNKIIQVASLVPKPLIVIGIKPIIVAIEVNVINCKYGTCIPTALDVMNVSVNDTNQVIIVTMKGRISFLKFGIVS